MTTIAAGCIALVIGAAPLPDSETVVSEVRVQTPYGTKTYYYLPADAPPQMRAAYKARELAERGVVIVEQTQELKLAAVNTERRVEAYRSNTAQTRFSSGAGVLPVTPGTATPVCPNPPASGAAGNPFNPGGFGAGGFGLGSGGSGWRDSFLGSESTQSGRLSDATVNAALALALAERDGDALTRFQKALAALTAAERRNEPTQRAIDRVADAEERANEQLREYLARKQKSVDPATPPPPKAAPPAEPKKGAEELLDAAVRQEQAARQREKEAFDRYQKAGAADRAEAKRVWERASQECDDARTVLKVARERAAERPK